jgi:hypothetical protein
MRLSRFAFVQMTLVILSGTGWAQSISINGVSIATRPGNTADFTSGNSSTIQGEQFLSQTQVLDFGGTSVGAVGATVDAGGRYASVAVADSAAPLGSSTVNATSTYRFSFSVNASPTLVYSLNFTTRRNGALTWVDDNLQPEPATAGIGAVAGSINGAASAGLALPGIANVTREGDFVTPIAQSNSVTLTGLTGNRTYNVDFQWNSYANSEATFFTGADEGAVRLGLNATLGGTSAGNYPGLGNRTIGNDGHFITVTATVIQVVPEASTLTMLAVGFTLVALRISTRKTST